MEEVVNAISWIHIKLSGLPAVGGSPFVGATWAGLQRMLATPKTKTEPIIADMFKLLVETMSSDSSLVEVLLAGSSLLAYASVLAL